MNEGGLFAERQGWHLPGFDTSSWTSRDLSEGLPSGQAGVGFFVTTFDLDVPRGSDVLMSFVYDGNVVSNEPYRSLLFVNGWQFGKVSRYPADLHSDADAVYTQRVANMGPQSSFPVPEGILDYHGTKYVGSPMRSKVEPH